MRTPCSITTISLAVILAGTHLWPLQSAAQQRRSLNLDDMFIAEDADAFDPGLPIGSEFPPINALYRGEEITAIDRFMGEFGAIFIANRSANW